MNSLYQKIEIDGNDGTGKTTLVSALRTLGFANVKDRGFLTKLVDDFSPKPENDNIIRILLDATTDICQERLLAAGKDLNEMFHTKQDLDFYRPRYLEAAEAYGAWVINCSNMAPEQVLEETLHLIMDRSFRIGLPNGRVANHIGLKNSRTLSNSFHGMEYFHLRSRAIPDMVANGLIDIGITGNDSMEESFGNSELETFHSVSQQNVKMSVAVADKNVLLKIKNRPVVVATTFPRIAENYLSKLGLSFIIIDSPGCIEGLCPKLADVIIDIIETGNTLKQNGLIEIEKLFDLSVVSIRKKENY